MKKKIVLLSSLLIAVALLMGVTSCKKSSSPPVFGLSTLVAQLAGGSIDMNGATPPTNVPSSPIIVANFTVNVLATSVTSSTVTLVRNYDGASIPLTVTVAGSLITITPQAGLGNGTLYQLTFKAGITSTDNQTLGAFNRTFTTIGTFVPDGMVAYYNFDNNVNDQMGTYNPSTGGIIDLTYVASYKTSMGQAGSFNGTTTLVEIPNGDLMENTNSFTLAFWVKADSTKHGQFVMGLAGWYGFQFEIAGDYSSCKLAAQYKYADGTSGSEDLWFPADGNLGWQGWTFCKNLTTQGGLPFLIANKWAYITCRYNADTKVGTMYINGDKMKEQDFNLWPAGDPKTTVTGLKYNGVTGGNTFVFGFIQDRVNPSIPDAWAQYSDPANNHFKGQLDNVRVFHKALTEQEIGLMYNSEKP